MSKFTVKSKKWYGRFWPPERRKIRIMQAIVDYKEDEIVKNYLMYGIHLTYTKYKSDGGHS